MRPATSLSILQAAVPAAVGGLESVLLELSSGLARRGHRVTLVAVVEPGTTIPPTLQAAGAAGVDVRPVTVRARAYRAEGLAHRAILADISPAVVHTHGYRADLIAGRVALRAGVPWLTTLHGFTGGGLKNRAYEWAQRRQARSAARAIAVSKGIQARLLESGVLPDRLALVPNAWSPKPTLERGVARARLGIDGGRPVIGWVGRLSHEKGADLFLRALAQLKGIPWNAVVVGDGPERARLRELADRMDIGGRVTWAGMLPEAYQYFAAFDAWVLSSRTEGTPISLFEAMSAGVPIVATAVGGVPDVVSAAEAWLVPPEDPLAIGAALAGILADPMSAAPRLAAARARLEAAFGVEPWLDAHEALYLASAATDPNR